MVRSIKLIYRYIYKYYLWILYLFLLLIIIPMMSEIIIQNLFYKHCIYQIKNLAYKKNFPWIILDVFNSNCYDKNLIHIDILEKSFSAEIIMNDFSQKCNSSIINFNDFYKLMQQYSICRYVQSGHIFSCLMFPQKKIKYLLWECANKEIRIYNNVHAVFTKSVVKNLKKTDWDLFYTVLFIGELDDTFINSARSLGLEEGFIRDIVNSLKYQIDFRKLCRGDRFSVLVCTYKVHGEDDLKNKLIGARINSSGKDYYVFRANNGKFYNKEAIRLEKNFIRFPLLQPCRISSKFNLNRLNPVTGVVSPHAGVDFAVPVGTPVLSIGDGEVIISKYSKVAGNYVVIRHNYQCITRYMHLTKILVKIGQKVKQGQKIALSGNTGRSTGPHLHFEVWIDNQPVNPLTVSMINTERLSGNERVKYLRQIKDIIPQLRFD